MIRPLGIKARQHIATRDGLKQSLQGGSHPPFGLQPALPDYSSSYRQAFDFAHPGIIICFIYNSLQSIAVLRPHPL